MSFAEHQSRFVQLCKTDSHNQAQTFLKSFIFDLGDDWKEVNKLCDEYNKYILLAQRDEEGVTDLNAAQASDFLQKHGKTRTGTQRKEELKDVDIDDDDRYTLIEYLLLHYKKMILESYYRRHKKTPPMDLSNGSLLFVISSRC